MIAFPQQQAIISPESNDEETGNIPERNSLKKSLSAFISQEANPSPSIISSIQCRIFRLLQPDETIRKDSDKILLRIIFTISINC